ncbi:hypothetical protein BGZ94_001181 [Podila epigama]|nr:hypothetical protein BGZ94_001181 [Podila epigama]
MNSDPNLDVPHYRHPSGGTLSSLDYEAGEESSVSSMDNQSSFHTNHNNHSTTSKQSNTSTILGYPHDSVIFDPSKKSSHPSSQHRQQQPPGANHLNQYASSNQTLTVFASPQSSPQSSRGHNLSQHHNGRGGNGHGPYDHPYTSSGSDDDHDNDHDINSDNDHDQFSSREPALLGDLPNRPPSVQQRDRRDSGLPPIKLSSAKRLPPFGASTSSIPAESLIEEEEEEEEDESGSSDAQQRHMRKQQLLQEQKQQRLQSLQQQQQQQLKQQKQQPRQQQHRREYYHEDDVESIPLDDTDDQDEIVEIRDRDMGSRQINILPQTSENGRPKLREYEDWKMMREWV